jgi:hypothetical protein
MHGRLQIFLDSILLFIIPSQRREAQFREYARGKDTNSTRLFSHEKRKVAYPSAPVDNYFQEEIEALIRLRLITQTSFNNG